MKQNPIFKNILYALQGAIVGVGAILPGVSGGVLCVAFGIYEPMMALMTHPRSALPRYYKMFIPFLIGWAAGFTVLARGVEILFDLSPTVALLLFFGLICGTLPELFKAAERSDRDGSWTPFVISLSLAYLFFQLLETSINTTIPPSFAAFLLCGALWGLSLIIPGLSSSTILIFLGLFEPLTEGIGSFDIGVLIPFVLGIGVTALLLARLVNMLYTRRYSLMSRIILGFVIASSLKILPTDFGNTGTLALSLACFAGGFYLALAMDKANDKERP